MNYAELLKRMPDELRRNLETGTYAPWLKRGASLADVCTDPAVMETILGRMNDAERTVLRIVVMRIGADPFDYGRLEKAAVYALSGAEARLGLSGLLRKGIVFAFRKSWGEYVYLLPADGFGLWRKLLFAEEPFGCVRPPDCAAPEVSRSARLGLRLELFQTLVFAARQGLKLSKNGTLHKKQLQKLAEQLSLDGALLEGASLKYAYADAYSLPVAVALDFLLRLQLLEQGEEELALHREAVGSWLSLGPQSQTKLLYEAWKQLTLPPQAWMQHAICMAEQLAESGEWFSAEAIVARLTSQGIAEEGGLAEEQAGELRERWLLPLVAFGWMEEGRSAGPGAAVWFRWTERPCHPLNGPEPEEEGGLMIQPDFEILAPPDVPLTALWELCCVADAVRFDQVSVFKLTKNSVRRALESGRTPEEIASFLERHALYGIPEHIALAVEQWAKPYGKTSFVQAVVLRCADEETAQSLERLPGVANYLREKLGGTHYLIRPDDVKPLSAAMEKAGFMPAFPTAWNGTDGPAQPETYPKYGTEREHGGEFAMPVRSADKGLIYARATMAYFEMEARLPHPAELYPELPDIPAVWLKDYRSYHASTRKEMVEKAIRMKTVLQIRKDGCDYRVAPHKLQETRGTWCMTGIGRAGEGTDRREEIRWMPEQWQEMKLILPGINDKY